MQLRQGYSTLVLCQWQTLYRVQFFFVIFIQHLQKCHQCISMKLCAYVCVSIYEKTVVHLPRTLFTVFQWIKKNRIVGHVTAVVRAAIFPSPFTHHRWTKGTDFASLLYTFPSLHSTLFPTQTVWLQCLVILASHNGISVAFVFCPLLSLHRLPWYLWNDWASERGVGVEGACCSQSLVCSRWV